MATDFGTVGLSFGAVALNAVRTVKEKRDPFPVIFAGAVVTTVFVLLGGLRPKLGLTAAAVFFIASALDSGPAAVDTVTKVVNSKSSSKAVSHV